MVFLRQRSQGFGQEYETLNRQGELSGPGAEQGANHPDNVSQINQALEAGVVLLAHYLALEVDLQPAAAILEVAEAGLAELPEEHQAAGQAKVQVQPCQLLPAEGAVFLDHLGDAMAGSKAVGKGVDSLVPQLL